MHSTVPAPPLLTRFAPALLAGSREGLAETANALSGAIDHALDSRRPAGPLPAGTPRSVLARVDAALGPAALPTQGVGTRAALARLATVLTEQGLDLSHPRAAAHLQPPPLSVAVAADALASASNASLDTYDSGPATLAIERWVIGGLTRLAKLGAHADGVLTPGGSLSNLLGLLLARDAAARRGGVDVRKDGIAALPRPVVFCSELAHFSVHRACAALGLGERAVRPIPTDGHRMRTRALSDAVRSLAPDETPVALIATAGTTDFGTIDPLPEIAEIASEHGIWFHVDAAYGFGALFSERLAPKLTGLELADSITVDLHKIGWQPAATSALLVSNTDAFGALNREVAYLNPSDDTAAGYDGLLGRSLQTTRRPDAVKVAATMLAHGVDELGQMVDHCHDLARHAEERVAGEPTIDLVSPAELTTVVFRYRSTTPDRDDEINGLLRRKLLESGQALIGRTVVRTDGPNSPERVCLKLTLLNPTASTADIDDVIDLVLTTGRHCELISTRQEGAA